MRSWIACWVVTPTPGACATCSAQNCCTAWASVRLLRDAAQGARLRSPLTDLLQACHQRGEIHITARELRAALSYCLFGIDHCDDLHAAPDKRPAPLWHRLFDAGSQRQQGELLQEMARFDPALESDPIIDRGLLRATASDGGSHRLADARRRAWLLGDGAAGQVRLMHRQHLARFRAVPAWRSSPSAWRARTRACCMPGIRVTRPSSTGCTSKPAMAGRCCCASGSERTMP